MISLNYEELEKQVIEAIHHNPKMVLSTSADNHVTSRMMSIIHNGLTIMFQTDIHFTKFQQIVINPNVSLCAGNMQIEGIAETTCHPYENPFFIENYRVSHESAFKRYSHLKDNIIIEVHPKLVTFWKYDQQRNPYRDFLDITEHRAYRELYSKEV